MKLRNILAAIGERLLFFVIGIIGLGVGGFLIRDEWNNRHGLWGAWPFIIFLVGLGGIYGVFVQPKKENKEKDTTQAEVKTNNDQKTGP